MKSRKEIEELLGKELQYVQHEVRSNSDWGNFGIDVLDTYWELTEDDIKKVKDLLESSIESNDIDTALGCCNLLGEKKVDKEVLQQLIDVTVQQLSEDVNSLNPETSIDKFKRITDKIHNVTRSNFSQNKSIIQLSELLENKINSIMTSLDGRITYLSFVSCSCVLTCLLLVLSFNFSLIAFIISDFILTNFSLTLCETLSIALYHPLNLFIHKSTDGLSCFCVCCSVVLKSSSTSSFILFSLGLIFSGCGCS